MRIAIISQVIFPRQSPRANRATELAKFFAKGNHEVYLYAVLGKYDYSKFEEETNVHVKSLGKMHFSTLNSDGHVRANFFDRILKRFFGRLIEWPDIELALKSKSVVKKLTNIDLLITIAIPHPIHWGAAWARKKMGSNFPKVWISDCGDPYMGNSIGKHPSYFQKIEDFWGKQTDYITIPIEEGRKGYSKKVQDKIRIIPQGFDFSSVKIDKTFKGNNIPHFAYAGAIYPGYRDPTKLLQYLCEKKNIEFVFTIYTRTPNFLQPFKKELGEKLIIKDYIPREQLLWNLSQMDFLINLLNNSSVQAPSKLIDYYLTNRPIIDISSSFNEEKTLDEFLNRNYTNRHVPADISKYDINNVGMKFLKLL